MKVITYATKETQYLDALKDSCQKFNYDLKILGIGTKWRGMGDKVLGVYNYLSDLIEDDLFLVVDAYDVIFCRESSTLERDFYENFSEKDVIFNSEVLSSSYIKKLEWELNYSNKHPKSDNKYTALNAGVIIGKRNTLVDFYKKLLDEKQTPDKIIDSDQRAIYQLFNANKYTNLVLDNKCKLFTVVTEFNNDIIVKNNKIYNNYTETFPYLIHGAGKKTSLNEYIDLLNLKTSYQKSKFKYNFFYYREIVFDYIVGLAITIFLLILYRMKSKFQTSN